MLQDPSLREWLLPAVDGDTFHWLAVICAVSGHHPAHGRPSPPRQPLKQGEGSGINLLTGRDDFGAALAWLRDLFELGPAPGFNEITLPLVGSGNVCTRICRAHFQAAAQWKALDADHKRFVAATKACVIAADVAGSALPQRVEDKAHRAQWITRAFGHTPTADEISQLVTDRLIA